MATTDWARSEFESLLGFADEMGCEGREARGPGLTLLLGKAVVVRLHPTLKYLNVGFPNVIRGEVATLTGALRGQRSEAWLRYRPEVCYRYTIETLITKSAHAATVRAGSRTDSLPPPAPAHPPSPTTGRDQSRSAPARTATKSPRGDRTDLRLILAMLQAFRTYEESIGSPAPIKAIREAIYFHWEQPASAGRKQVLATIPAHDGSA